MTVSVAGADFLAASAFSFAARSASSVFLDVVEIERFDSKCGISEIPDAVYHGDSGIDPSQLIIQQYPSTLTSP